MGQILLKFISNKLIIQLAWNLIDPLIKKRIEDSKSKIDDSIYAEIRSIVLKLIQDA